MNAVPGKSTLSPVEFNPRRTESRSLPYLVPVPGLERELFQLQGDPEAGFDAALRRIEEGREYYRWAHHALSLDPSEYHTMLRYLDYLKERLRRRLTARVIS